MAVPLEELLRADREALASRLVPLDTLLPELPSAVLSPVALERVKNGMEVGPADLSGLAAGAAAADPPDGAGRPVRGPGQTGQNPRVSPRFGRFGLSRPAAPGPCRYRRHLKGRPTMGYAVPYVAVLG